MKKAKRNGFFTGLFALVIMVGILLALASCTNASTGRLTPSELPSGGIVDGLDGGGKGGGIYHEYASDAKEGYSDGGETGEPADGDESPSSEPQDVQRPAGLITAAAWNENLHYDFWKSLFTSGQTEEDSGKFWNFYQNHRWGFDSTQRVTVTVKQGETPVCGATVTCLDESGNQRFAAKTGADGIAYLFPEASAGTIKVKSGEFSAELPFGSATCELEVQLEGSEAKQNVIQLMLVVDVTGSMGDELDYLKAELADVIGRIAEANSGVQIELALLFYRDNGDAEKFSYHDFVNVNSAVGLNKQLTALSRQRAEGGGDYEEAVDEALELAMSKAWRNDSSTKIIFHVLDAPPHANGTGDDPQANYEQRFEKAVRAAAEKGVRLCPILCSGADATCEYLMRQEAIYTGGTFIFVTDDSGIGNEHLDPDLPDVVVEKLNDLMVRVVDGYHTGTFADPVPWKTEEEQTQNQQ